MKISGVVEGVVYRNDENGYSVLNLSGGTTAIGFFPYIVAGNEIDLVGDWVSNAKYGKQFKVAEHEIKPPSNIEQIRQFIGSGLISGIGEKTAKLIVDTFGVDTLAIMEHRPDELSCVRGISPKKAEAIGERYGEVKQMQKSVGFLQRFDISLNLAIKIFNHYKDKTIETVQQNPYKLIEAVDGVGFVTADKMAKDLGIAYSGKFRVRAGAVYCLKTAVESDGHTCLPIDNLFALTMRLLRITKEKLEPIFNGVIEDLCVDKYLTRAGDRIALTRYYNHEQNIAKKIKFLGEQKFENGGDLDALIQNYEQINNIKLHEMQRTAVKSAVNNGISVITGGPGTGKTTIIRAVLFINNARKHSTQLLAPTGRAAKRLEEVCTRDMPIIRAKDNFGEFAPIASTIHRALDIDFKGGKGHFIYDDPENYLRADVVIVDEVSMCDVVLMHQLVNKVMHGTRLILVGDIDQLASVGPGNVLCDIINSGIVPVVRLTQIYRQDEKSKIVLSAHAINRGEMPDAFVPEMRDGEVVGYSIKNNSTDFFVERAESPTEIKQKVLALVTERLPKFLGKDKQIQVLCPMKQGEAGMIALNTALQEKLNPHEATKAEYIYGESVYRLGDRVMQTKNEYDLGWVRENATGSGVFNGDMGEIIDLNPQNGEVTVQFEDGRVATYMRADLQSLTTCYAITVHKSQGCEFDAVVIPITAGAYMILTRNLLYTAVTRAKSFVMLVGSAENIKKMVENTYTKRRYTLLQEFLGA